MEHEQGDDYIRRISTFIRDNERALAEAGLSRRRRRTKQPVETSLLNPFGWFGTTESTPPPPKPVHLTIDIHHLFYVLMRLEDIGIDIGTLDVKVDNPSKPMNYINIFRDSDKSDTLSLSSFRSSLSAVSSLSLGGGWWAKPEPRNIEAELKYIYSSFTKLPALILTAPGPKVIAELANEPPNENCLPLDSFKNLQNFECADIDPRIVLGWDRMSDSLRSLTVKRSGLEDVSDIFIGAVLDDQSRREGTTYRSRRRHISQGSKQTAFYSTRLPDTVVEANEDSVPAVTQLPTDTKLPRHKWSLLRHLSLSDNALTFLPTDPLPYLTSLTHLDLSSNLLVSIPPGLSSLYKLVSLNLSDNMIDSVLGIYTQLGQILSLNLSRNRLESICGLERLLALERVDLRHNSIEESAEVGRLAMLPHITDVWVEGNPFVEIEENYRVTCFDYFWKEGKSITLDGAAPGFYERRGLSVAPPQQMSSSRPSSKAYSPPVVAVGDVKTQASPQLSADKGLSPAGSSPASQTDSPGLAPVGVVGKERRRKNKRIVVLDGEGAESGDGSSRIGFHIRTKSGGAKATTQAQRDLSPRQSLPAINVEIATPPTEPQPQQAEFASASSSPSTLTPRRPRHIRYQSELLPSNVDINTLAPLPESPASIRHPDRSAILSNKSATRRARVSASVYEPSTDSDAAKEADAFRRRIEALRTDMGEGWLNVYNQSQIGSPGVASG